MKSFNLEIVTQETHLLSETINSLTLPTASGEITILADHIPLFSRLEAGELTYTKGNQHFHLAITGGFVDMAPTNVATVLADSAVRSEQINLAKAQEAVENAKKALAGATDTKTTLKIEMELRAALIQTHIAKKYQNKG